MRRLALPLLFLAILGLAMLAGAPGSFAQQPVRVRVGDHPGHGRVVFDWPRALDYHLEQVGDVVRLRFPELALVDFSGARRLPRNVVGVTQGKDGIEIAIRPEARIRYERVGSRIIVDVLDPVSAAPPTIARPAAAPPKPDQQASVAQRPEPAPPPRPVTLPVAAMSEVVPSAEGSPAARAPAAPANHLPAAPRAGTPTTAPTVTAPNPHSGGAGPAAAPSSMATLPGLTVRVLRLPGRSPTLALPFPAGTGAALLRRDGALLAVFDHPALLDLAALRGDPVFGSATAMSLPGGVALQVPLPPPATLNARRDGGTWLLEAIAPTGSGEVAPPSTGRGLTLEADAAAPSSLVLRATHPGTVVTLADPESGLPLLLGTVREAGQAMPVGRRLPELDLPATLLGAAVLARADTVTLRAGRDRFTVGTSGGARLTLDAAMAQDPEAAGMTRLFDLPGLPAARLLDRLRLQQGSIVAAAPLARLPQRRAAAETLLALGLPQEAQAMLELGRLEDPNAVPDRSLAALAALAAVAALVAGRLPEATALQDPTLAGSDELTLWRAILAAARGDARAAAPGLAATLPLLLGYPEGLRARLLPPAALALAEVGDATALEHLLGAAGPGLNPALPRAVLAEFQGRVDDALAGYAAAARSRDRQTRALALRRDVELQLASGRMEPLQAARALDAALFAWRGDEAEFPARLRVAELWRLAGDAAASLALLRDTEALFPDQAALLRPPMQLAFVAALDGKPPLAAVALFDAYPELLPTDARGEAAVATLADRLVALDLTDRAATLLRQALDRAVGQGRATLGLRLAALRLAEDDAPGALAALQASATPDLPERLLTDRAIVAARAEARRGRLPVAIAALRAQGAAGLGPLIDVLTEAQDWAGAAAALGSQIASALPPVPAPLDEDAHRLLVRQAAMLALAGDEPALAALRAAHSERLRDGALQGAFTLLTGDPLRGLGDLPRLQRELQLFRSLPSRLEALRAGGPITR